MNILDKRATNPAAALDGTELVYVAQLGDDAVTTVQDIITASANSIRIDSATYAEIPSLTNPCFVFVDADETNGGQPTIYFFDGTNLNWIPAVGV